MDWIAIPLGFLVMAGTLAGGYLGLRFAHTLPTVLALSGGIVVAVAVLDLMPESVELLGDPHDAAILIAVGFLIFFLLERVLVLHHRDDPEQARSHHQVGAAGALGLSAHGFTDGLAIGLAFGVNSETGVLVFLAVIAHDFADGLNTVSFVLSQSGDRNRAVRWLRVNAVAPVLGAIVGTLVTVSDMTLGYILALYTGFFLYLGGTDLLPEAHHEHGSWARVGLTVLGFAFVFGVSQLAHV